MKKVAILLLVLSFLMIVKISTAQTREQTTIQTTTFDVPNVKDAAAFSYLDFPWGEVTFGYIEKGTKGNYYGERTWPFAQLNTKTALTLEGAKIAPGQYALVITPGGEDKPMSLSVISFVGPTFLKPGNIFSPAPKGTSVYTKDVSFQTVDTSFDHMKIETVGTATGFDLVVIYGNRRLVKSFATK
jgi:hypothetical protein